MAKTKKTFQMKAPQGIKLPNPAPPYLPAPDPVIGVGGGHTRETIIPNIAPVRKHFPIASGFLDYFPDAVAAVSEVSYVGNAQHNGADSPVFWNRGKSTDEADAMLRHVVRRGTRDVDGLRHSAKLAWRAMANLQKEIEAENVEGETHE